MERHIGEEGKDRNLDFRYMSVKDIRDFMHSEEGERRVIQFIEKLRSEVGNKEGYKKNM